MKRRRTQQRFLRDLSWRFLYLYVYIFMYIYIYMHKYVQICIYIHIYISMCMHSTYQEATPTPTTCLEDVFSCFIFKYTYIYIYMHTYIFTFTYIYTNICVHIPYARKRRRTQRRVWKDLFSRCMRLSPIPWTRMSYLPRLLLRVANSWLCVFVYVMSVCT